MRQRLIRLVIIFLLLIAVLYANRYRFTRPQLEEPGVNIPLDAKVKETINKEDTFRKDLSAMLEFTEKYYWNAWLSERAIANGGWRNILPLCTENFKKSLEKEEAYRDTVSIGTVAPKVKKITLDAKRSKVVEAAVNKEARNRGAVLVDIWLKVTPKRGLDYYIHTQSGLLMIKKNNSWFLDGIEVYRIEEKPADLLPE